MLLLINSSDRGKYFNFKVLTLNSHIEQMRITNMSHFKNKVLHTHHTSCSLPSLLRHLVLIRVHILCLVLVAFFILYVLYLCSVQHYVVNVRVIFHPDLNHLQQPGNKKKILFFGIIFLVMADISNVSSLQYLWVWKRSVGCIFSSKRADISNTKGLV